MSSFQNEFQTSGRTEAGQDPDEFDAEEVSSQEQAEHTAGRVAAALEATQLIDIVEVKASVGQVHLLGRVHKDNEKAYTDTVLFPILEALEKAGIDSHGCKQFLPKKGKRRYGWVLSFASSDLRDAAFKALESFEDVIPRREIMQAPLVGPKVPQSGGQLSGRKGAAPIRG
jgi:hypothetical protein